jgi:hypothetical protein
MEIKKSIIKKQLLLHCLGIIEGVKQEVITMDEATRLFLKPYLSIWLEKHSFDRDFIDLIWKAIELEDLGSLGKDIFDKNLEEVYQDIIHELKNSNNNELISKSLCHFALNELDKHI